MPRRRPARLSSRPRSAPATFTFAVDLVSLGWLRVEVGDDRQRVEVLASYITPALDHLLAALASLTAGEPRACASWELEPAECRWLMALDPHGHVLVRVLLLPDRCRPDPPEGGHLVLDADVPLPQLVRLVVEASRDLLTRFGEDGYARLWAAGPFPTGHLRSLEQWLADHDPDAPREDGAR